MDVLSLLPSDEDVEKCIVAAYRALRPGGVLICDIYNALAAGRSEARRLTIGENLVTESRGRGIRITAIESLKDYDPVHGVGWIHTTSIVEAPDSRHVFRGRERFRFFTYWEMIRILNQAGFKEPSYYHDWKTNPVEKPKAAQIVFVARK